VLIQTKRASGVVDGQGFASSLLGRGLNLDELRRYPRGCVSPRTSALLQLRQSLATLHSQAENNQESVASALRLLNPVHEKDFP
jgi:hypothetical protein